MKNKFIFAILFGIFLFGIASSFTNLEVNQISCSTFESGKAGIVGTEIPEKVPYKNELFNIYLGGDFFGYIQISESKLSDLGCIENEDATYNVYIKDLNTIKDVSGDNSTEIILEKIKSKEIEIKGASFGKKMKWTFTKVLLRWFG